MFCRLPSQRWSSVCDFLRDCRSDSRIGSSHLQPACGTRCRLRQKVRAALFSLPRVLADAGLFWPEVKDNGYQMMDDRDAPIWRNPSYSPVTFRVTPIWHRWHRQGAD